MEQEKNVIVVVLKECLFIIGIVLISWMIC